MSALAPASPTAHYRARREAGSDHERALAEVQHSYGRTDLAPLLARVRDEYEQAGATLDGRVAVDTPPGPVDDAFTVAENELTAKIDVLSGWRQALSFDAMTDATKANELAGVENDLAACESALEHTRLARTESSRREREAEEIAKQEALRQALDGASELGVERDHAEAKLSKAATAFASAVAALDAVASEQSRVLEGVGQPGAWLSPGEVRGVLMHALASQGVRTDWFD
jgi:hypothetical protein